jgi:hypothetical protein
MRRIFVPLALLPGLGMGPVALAAEAPPGADTIPGSGAEGDWVGCADDLIGAPHDPGFDYILRGPSDDAPPIVADPPPVPVGEPGTGVQPATADQTPVAVGNGR